MSIYSNQVARNATQGRSARKSPLRSLRNAFAFLAVGLILLSGPSFAGALPNASTPLDLNRATVEQLVELPGIGDVKAAAILAVRDERGGFGSLSELESVRGIGPALSAKLRPLLKLGAKSKKTARK
jgi:competence ComEA-like helix-hairpin-helix protein